MIPDTTSHHAPTLRHYLSVVRRRKWIAIATALLVPLAALIVSSQQQPLYEGYAEVLLNRQNLAASLTGTADPNVYDLPRVAETQAKVATNPAIAARTLEAARVQGTTPTVLLARTEIEADPNTDLLSFRVTDADARLATVLTTEYARQFTAYRRELDTGSLVSARRQLAQRLSELRQSGDGDPSLISSLVEKEQQLRTLEALQTSNASLVRTAGEPEQVQPLFIRNAILGSVLGLFLGLGLAFLREALDTRVRSAEEVAERLGLRLLGRLPAPARKLRGENRLTMLVQPQSAHAEAIRMLKTNLEFASLGKDVRTVMITSSVEGEGKSTTISNLALAFARSGRSVILVDLDLRRPAIQRFFDLNPAPGLTNVALGHVPLDEALVPIYLGEEYAPNVPALAGGNGRLGDRQLEVLTAGPIPPHPGDFLNSENLIELLGGLRDRADLILIDAPPLLLVGDTLALTSHVDALFIVTRLNVARWPMIRELKRLVDTSPSEKLGFVVTDADVEDEYGYGEQYDTYQGRERMEYRDHTKTASKSPSSLTVRSKTAGSYQAEDANL